MSIKYEIEPMAARLAVSSRDKALSLDGFWISAHLDLDGELFEDAWSIYNGSFVDFERRSFFEQMSIMRLPRYRFCAIQMQGVVAGVLGLWELEHFCFIEHVAITPVQRGSGVGSRTIKALQRSLLKPIVLDVEPFGRSFDASRRVSFYQRLGFHYCAHAVTLPPYMGKQTEPSNLMSWPLSLDHDGREDALATIEREVYGLHPRLPRRHTG